MKCQKSKIFDHVRKKKVFFKTKAQITIFIVLGIVVVIIFGLVNFISNQSSDVALEKKINKIYGDFLSSSNIKYLANDCMERTSGEALLLIGLQGSRIYDYQAIQGHSIKDFYDVIPFNDTRYNSSGIIYNVSYGIRAPTTTPYPNASNYPYLSSLKSDVSDILQDLFINATKRTINSNDFIFAEVENKSRFTLLTPLCNKIGPNDPSILGAGISCETTSPNNRSVQEYIKLYVTHNIKDCINFTLRETSKYNISLGNISIVPLIGETDLLVSMRYPIVISLKNKPPITKYIDFNIRPKVRLKTVHEIASHIIGHNRIKSFFDPSLKKTYSESNNIFFNITGDDPTNCFRGSAPCIVPGIKVSKLRDYCLNNPHCNFGNPHYRYSDIIIIQDNHSIIDGVPYMFLFAVENRRPALDIIDESIEHQYYNWYLNITYGRNLTQTYSNISGHPTSDEYEIITEGSDRLEIFPFALDPDEDNLTYRYKVISSPPPINWNDADFENSIYYTRGFSNRTNISSFLSDHSIAKDANPSTGLLGSGTYDNVVMINVSDNEGLYDYQNITIRVVVT